MASASFTKLARDLLGSDLVAAIHVAHVQKAPEMDARLVLARTPPIAQASAATFEPEVRADDFAAHLPPDEPAQTSNTPSRIQEARDEDAAHDKDDSDRSDTPQDDATLSTPFGPTLIRPQNSVVTYDLSAILAQTAAAASPTVPSVAPTPPEGAATAIAPETAAANVAQQARPEEAKAAAPLAALPGLEALASVAATQGKTEPRPLKTLRAGRDGANEAGPDFKPPATAGASSASPSAGPAKVETAVAVQPVAPPARAPEPPPATDTGSQLLAAAPAEQRAHRLNEAAGPAGHRPTTPAALVAQHVIRRFDGRSTSIDVRLDPAELGRVQVKLDVDADNRVTAVVSAENPAALADLVRSSRELERALQDAGLHLDSGDLTFDLAQRGDGEAPGSQGDGTRSDVASQQSAESIRTPTRTPRPFGLETWRGARVDVMV